MSDDFARSPSGLIVCWWLPPIGGAVGDPVIVPSAQKNVAVSLEILFQPQKLSLRTAKAAQGVHLVAEAKP